MPSVDLGAEVTLGQQASVRRNPAQAHRLGMLPRRELPGPLGMLSGLGSQRPTLLGVITDKTGRRFSDTDISAGEHTGVPLQVVFCGENK